MFKRTGDKSSFDAVALVEVTAKQLPDGEHPVVQARLCYVDSKTGMTFGYVDLVHNPTMGFDVLSKEALDAWRKFCEEVEKQQCKVLFGGAAQLTQMEFGLDDSQPESNEGIKVGLGGGT